MSPTTVDSPALASARRKVYLRALPLLFVCYIIAYVDRTNVGIAQLTMAKSLPEFTAEVIGWGAGIFFFGYFLLEIPGTLLVERWSASKWICRIMVTWGVVAAMTAFVTKPWHFYTIRFLLGLAEAGFFPGVIVYLTHWFPVRDRARALSIFLIASPIAMIVGNALSSLILDIGENGAPLLFGLKGWQCVFIFWGIPAVVMGIVVVLTLSDRPHHAKWLKPEERDALEAELEKERAAHRTAQHMSVFTGLTNPNVLMLCLAYFGVVTGNYGVEMFLPRVLQDWYDLGASKVALLATIPSFFVIVGQLAIGWSSDRFHERRWHATLPIVAGAMGLILANLTQGNLVLTLACFTLASAGMKAYMPAFWALPNMYLTAVAAAGSIGLINSVGNLGGALGPIVVGSVKEATGSYDIGIYFLATTCLISSSIICAMPYLHRRWAALEGTRARVQALGVLACLAIALTVGVSWWIKDQLKPWGLTRADVVAAQVRDDQYVSLLADSLNDWFKKKPKMRDVLANRLSELQTGCQQLAEHPPKQISDPEQRQKLTRVLEKCDAQLAGLKEALQERDPERDRYKNTVANGLEAADAIVRETQDELRQLATSAS